MKLLRASALGVLLLLAAIIPSPLRAQSTDAPNTRTIDGVAVTEVTCAPDVYDCDNGEFIAYLEDDAPETAQCAPYNNHFVNPDTLKWVVGCAAVVAMLMAYGIGSNDAANSWGTSVGSGAIPLRWGCLIGGLMEWAGAVSIGYGVAKTIKGTAKIDDPNCFACGMCNSAMSMYAVAMFSALFAASIFLLLASTTWMPVSTTHAIIGGAVGATWAATQFSCLNWSLDGGLGAIMLSWVCSPLLSGIIASIAYFSTEYTIIRPKLGGNPRRNALIAVPILYGMQAYVMCFLILLKAPVTKKLYTLNQLAIYSIPAGVAIAVAGGCFVWLFVKKRLPSVRAAQGTTEDKGKGASVPEVEMSESQDAVLTKVAEQNQDPLPAESPHGEKTKGAHMPSPQEALDSARELGEKEYEFMATMPEEDDGKYDAMQKDAIFCFQYLLVFVAALESFAHGSNDTGNATGAFSAALQTFQEGTEDCNKPQTPVWVMAVAGFFVFLGVNTYGYRVIQTVGSSITKINFHRGWCVEFASTFTVIIATAIEMPVSTTHCQVGGVVAVGLSAFGPKKVSWALFGKIFATWVLTLPFSGGIAAAMTAALRPAVFGSGR